MVYVHVQKPTNVIEKQEHIQYFDNLNKVMIYLVMHGT